jgi:hypothetical protein
MMSASAGRNADSRVSRASRVRGDDIRLARITRGWIVDRLDGAGGIGDDGTDEELGEWCVPPASA